MGYIGVDINYGDIHKQVATSSGSTTPTGALDFSVPKSESIIVTLDGVTQVPGTDYNVTGGTTLTFTTSVSAGVVVLVYFLGKSLDIGTPADNTVTSAKIVNGTIVNDDVNASAAIVTSKLSGAVTSIASHGLGALASLGAVDTGQITANAVDETKLKDALISDFTEVTVATGDSILLGDATDSGNTKRDTVQGILDLVTAAGADTDLGNLSATGMGRACQSWCNFEGYGTVGVNDSGGIHGASSITDNGTGDYTVNFASAMANATYSVSASAARRISGETSVRYIGTDGFGGYATGSIRLYVAISSVSPVDTSPVTVTIFGD